MIWLLEHSLLILYISIPTIGLLYMLYEYLKRKQEEKREQRTEFLRELSMYVSSDYCEFVKEHKGYSEDKALREFFSVRGNTDKAFKEMSERQKREKKLKEEAERKEWEKILSRQKKN